MILVLQLKFDDTLEFHIIDLVILNKYYSIITGPDKETLANPFRLV